MKPLIEWSDEDFEDYKSKTPGCTVEDLFDAFKSIVTTIRKTRSYYNVFPSQKIRCFVEVQNLYLANFLIKEIKVFSNMIGTDPDKIEIKIVLND